MRIAVVKLNVTDDGLAVESNVEAIAATFFPEARQEPACVGGTKRNDSAAEPQPRELK
jgi:hypothetical protein